ncbi:hypothetical protein B0H16DRAFT_1612448 [Mycena metata]|uniref:Uncharacterized protein n=1 Tax=Mycena metata TaxID=1033252 RepID=A0AAD7HD33_9AGAR|nr:hypothetical protein B0H16DRAFT_1612448 [Mycena metata]
MLGVHPALLHGSSTAVTAFFVLSRLRATIIPFPFENGNAASGALIVPELQLLITRLSIPPLYALLTLFLPSASSARTLRRNSIPRSPSVVKNWSLLPTCEHVSHPSRLTKLSKATF